MRGKPPFLPRKERSLLWSLTQCAAERVLVEETRKPVGAVGRKVHVLPPDPDVALGK